MAVWKRVLAGVVAVVAVLSLMAVAAFASIVTSFPTPQGARIKSGEIVGIDAEGAYVWIVPTADHGVVLIDTGFDLEAVAVRAALHGRPIHGILLTHGHRDHVGGIGAFSGVPVYAGPGELPLVRGDILPRGVVARVVARLMRSPSISSANLHEVKDGEILVFGSESFEVLHVPGHTGGSTIYLWEDVAFTGDTLLGHESSVAPVHWAFADDYGQNLESLERLATKDFERIADGHSGVHEGAKERLQELLR